MPASTTALTPIQRLALESFGSGKPEFWARHVPVPVGLVDRETDSLTPRGRDTLASTEHLATFDDLHAAVNEAYSKWDDGELSGPQTRGELALACRRFTGR